MSNKKEKPVTIHQVLANIQAELNAPKSKWNSYGNYKFRSTEDILEGVKPLCFENDALLILSDDIVEISGRVYVKATATLVHESGKIETTAFAREAANQKGMADAQLSGATSTYARKYALNAMFLIDDNKDQDTDEKRKEQKARIKEEQELKKKAMKKEYQRVIDQLAGAQTLEEFNEIKSGVATDSYKRLKKPCPDLADKLHKYIETKKQELEDVE